MTSYLESQRRLLLSGSSIYFGNIGTIRVTNDSGSNRYSTSVLAYSVSKELAVPYNTTLGVIKSYISLVRTCLELGYSTTFKSLLGLKSTSKNDSLNVYSSVSTTLIEELEENNLTVRASIVNWRKVLGDNKFYSSKEFNTYKELLFNEPTMEEESMIPIINNGVLVNGG